MQPCYTTQNYTASVCIMGGTASRYWFKRLCQVNYCVIDFDYENKCALKMEQMVMSDFCTGLPDENGRLQILNIHTEKLRENEKLAPDVSIDELATVTKNFSGAELEGLVRAAASTAMNRLIKVRLMGGSLS